MVINTSENKPIDTNKRIIIFNEQNKDKQTNKIC